MWLILKFYICIYKLKDESNPTRYNVEPQAVCGLISIAQSQIAQGIYKEVYTHCLYIIVVDQYLYFYEAQIKRSYLIELSSGYIPNKTLLVFRCQTTRKQQRFSILDKNDNRTILQYLEHLVEVMKLYIIIVFYYIIIYI